MYNSEHPAKMYQNLYLGYLFLNCPSQFWVTKKLNVSWGSVLEWGIVYWFTCILSCRNDLLSQNHINENLLLGFCTLYMYVYNKANEKYIQLGYTSLFGYYKVDQQQFCPLSWRCDDMENGKCPLKFSHYYQNFFFK